MTHIRIGAALLAVSLFGCPGDDSSSEPAGSSGPGSTGSASTGNGGSSTAAADGTGTSGAAESTSTGVGQGSSSGDPTSTGSTGGGAACFPEGIYGRCSENPGCQCLQGANVYQVCTTNCTETSECGDAADFPGATPLCAPLNPGAADMICVLLCTRTADCPCGLECQPSGVPNTNICVESQ